MLKKLIAVTIALMILTSLTMTVFAGNTEGASDVAATPTSVGAAKNSSLPKETSQTDKSSTSKTDVVSNQEQGSADADDKKSTYDDNEIKGPDAEFYIAIKKVLDEGKAVDNKLAIVMITKPEAINEKVSIYSKKFSISVKAEFDDVVFSVARLNSETGKYERIEFDGEKSIKLACGTETKEVILEYGINNLLLISYRDSEKLESKVQYNTIVVEANRESAADKAISPEKTVKKPSSDPLITLDQSFKTFINNLMGKGK